MLPMKNLGRHECKGLNLLTSLSIENDHSVYLHGTFQPLNPFAIQENTFPDSLQDNFPSI